MSDVDLVHMESLANGSLPVLSVGCWDRLMRLNPCRIVEMVARLGGKDFNLNSALALLYLTPIYIIPLFYTPYFGRNLIINQEDTLHICSL